MHKRERTEGYFLEMKRRQRIKSLLESAEKGDDSLIMSKKVTFEKKVLSENDKLAAEIRTKLQQKNIFSLNFVSLVKKWAYS